MSSNIHPRTAIREAVKELLNGKTDCKNNVVTGQFRSAWPTKLPQIMIITPDEEPATELNSAPRRQKRTAKLHMEIYGDEGDGLDTVLDTIALQIERLLDRDHTLSGTANNSRYVKSQLLLTPEAKNRGVLSVIYYVEYLRWTPERVENDESLVDLKGANVKFDIAPADKKVDAESEINLEEVTDGDSERVSRPRKGRESKRPLARRSPPR